MIWFRTFFFFLINLIKKEELKLVVINILTHMDIEDILIHHIIHKDSYNQINHTKPQNLFN